MFSNFGITFLYECANLKDQGIWEMEEEQTGTRLGSQLIL